MAEYPSSSDGNTIPLSPESGDFIIGLATEDVIDGNYPSALRRLMFVARHVDTKHRQYSTIAGNALALTCTITGNMDRCIQTSAFSILFNNAPPGSEVATDITRKTDWAFLQGNCIHGKSASPGTATIFFRARSECKLNILK